MSGNQPPKGLGFVQPAEMLIDQPHVTAHPQAAQEMLAQLLAPSQEQLAKPSQFVTLHNTCEQTHFIYDRYNQAHEFLGGQKKQIEMTTDGIDTLRHWARTDRGHYLSGHKKGQPFPAHPVRIIDVGPIRCNGIELPAAPSEPERPQVEA